MFRRSFFTIFAAIPFVGLKTSEPIDETDGFTAKVWHQMAVDYSNDAEYWKDRALLAEKDLDSSNKTISRSLDMFNVFEHPKGVRYCIGAAPVSLHSAESQNVLYHHLKNGHRPVSHPHFGTYLDGNDPLLP